MYRIKRVLFNCLLLLIVSTIAHAQVRKKENFNNNWRFILDSVNNYSDTTVNDASWRKLNLPHDWSIEGTFSKEHPATAGGGALPGGLGWYRKTFKVPATSKDKTVFIGFDGVYRNSEVFINGHSLGIRPNGYISFQYDLTPYLNYGTQPNVIAVNVDNLRQPNSRWYSGSGIYRNVWLTTVDKIHVINWGTFITTPEVSAASATVNIITSIQNQYKTNQPITLNTTVFDAEGKKVAQCFQA